MITLSFEDGRKVSNAAVALGKYFPLVSGGQDYVEEIRKHPKSISLDLKLYVAYRMAADPNLRGKDPDEIMNEVNISNVDQMLEFKQVMSQLGNEGNGSKK
jgi:hypothetical protein